jgi:hypothetical protein
LSKINPEIIKLIGVSIGDLADDDGWAYLGDLGNLILKKKPDFDSRNYGYFNYCPLLKVYKNLKLMNAMQEKII